MRPFGPGPLGRSRLGPYSERTIINLTRCASGLKFLLDEPKPEFLAQLGASAEDFASPPMPLGMTTPDGDGFVIVEGPGQGMKGYFARDDAGRVSAVHLGGRLATRI